MLKEGEKIQELRDSYTIFITEKDYYKDGLPLYTIERQVQENGRDFLDGSHIIYVNGEYEGDDALGKLMKDFKCKNAKDMYYPELAEGVRYFKEAGGRESMCELVEEYAKKYAADRDAKIENLEAEKENLEAENLRLREELAKLKK